MELSIEVKEIKLGTTNIYIYDKYPEDGLYVIKKTEEVVYVCNELVVVIALKKEMAFIEVKEEQEKGVVSEEFALKMLAVAQGQKYKEVN